MSYIVKNCTSLDSDGTTCQDCSYKDCGADDCINRTDCIIKQVIEMCKKMSGKCERCQAREDYQPTDCLDYCSNDDVIFADDILQLFDIEEINK